MLAPRRVVVTLVVLFLCSDGVFSAVVDANTGVKIVGGAAFSGALSISSTNNPDYDKTVNDWIRMGSTIAILFFFYYFLSFLQLCGQIAAVFRARRGSHRGLGARERAKTLMRFGISTVVHFPALIYSVLGSISFGIVVYAIGSVHAKVAAEEPLVAIESFLEPVGNALRGAARVIDSLVPFFEDLFNFITRAHADTMPLLDFLHDLPGVMREFLHALKSLNESLAFIVAVLDELAAMLAKGDSTFQNLHDALDSLQQRVDHLTTPEIIRNLPSTPSVDSLYIPSVDNPSTPSVDNPSTPNDDIVLPSTPSDQDVQIAVIRTGLQRRPI